MTSDRPSRPGRISLAEARAATGTILTRGASSELETGAAPTLDDLTEALHFALGDGRIWLNDQRMVLMQSLVLGPPPAGDHRRLRHRDRARGLFMRVGYMQGVRDAELIAEALPARD